jgi:hypothetical protein
VKVEDCDNADKEEEIVQVEELLCSYCSASMKYVRMLFGKDRGLNGCLLELETIPTN